MEAIYKCHVCGKEYKRNNHYLAILEMQNSIMIDEIIDMCGSCNYMEYKYLV